VASWRLGSEGDRLAIDDEGRAPAMMDRPRRHGPRGRRGLRDLEYEKIELVHETRVEDRAFEVGVTLGDEGRSDPSRRPGPNPDVWNFSASRPERLPVATSLEPSSTVEIAITQSFAARTPAKL
jgi:hypothetical protein